MGRTLYMMLYDIAISLQSIYYVVGITSLLCSAAFKLGYEIGKNTRK